MKKLLLITLFTPLLLAGCKQNSQTTKDGNFKQTVVVEEDRIKTLNDNTILSYPVDMVLAGDNIVILDASTSPCIQVFSKQSGKKVNSLVFKGRAANEVVNTGEYMLHNQECVGVFDGFTSKVVLCNINRLADTTLNSELKSVEFPKVDMAERVYLLGDRALMRTRQPMNRYVWIDSEGNTIPTNNPFPVLYEEDPELNAQAISYAAQIAVSPDMQNIVEATYLGGRIEFISLVGDKLTTRNSHSYSDMAFEMVGDMISWADDTVQGFTSMDQSKEFVYTNYAGNLASKRQKSSRIRKYSWGGEELTEYLLPMVIGQIAVDESTDTLYATARNEDGVYNIISIQL